jgi:hypothetical protein
MGAPKHRIEVKVEPSGYTLFSIGERKVLGFQILDGTYHLIPAEMESWSSRDATEVRVKICEVLRRAGGDLAEMLCRPQLPFLMP